MDDYDPFAPALGLDRGGVGRLSSSSSSGAPPPPPSPASSSSTSSSSAAARKQPQPSQSQQPLSQSQPQQQQPQQQPDESNYSVFLRNCGNDPSVLPLMRDFRQTRSEDSSWASRLDAAQMGALRKQVLKSIMEYDSGNRIRNCDVM